MAWLKRGSANIHFEWIESDDPHAKETLILIHGVGLDMHSWDFIVPYFRSNYHIIRYDIRGHGESDAGDEKRTIELLCEDLTNLISELDIQSYHIIAQGLGGFLGVQLASQKEKNLKTLVLMGVPIHYPKQLGDKIVKQRKDMVQGQPSMLAMGLEIVKKICYPPTEAKVEPLLNAYKNVSPTVYFELFHTGFGETGTINLQKITIKILILSGSEDAIFPPELLSASLNFNPNARYYTVPDASFMIQMDQPRITAEWIVSFIKKNKDERQYISLLDYDYQKHLTSQMYSEIRGMLKQGKDPLQSINELQVNIMNGFSVRINGKRVLEGWGKRKAKQIFLYLVIHQSVTRDQLCDIFWPEVDLESARNRLRVSLHHMKQLIEAHSDRDGTPILVTDREHVFLEGKIQSDLLIHIEAIKKVHHIEDNHKKSEQFKQLLTEKTENPLPGLYEDWFLNLRDWIEKEWAEMSLFLVDRYEKQKDYKNAVYYMELALNYHPDDDNLSKRLLHLKKQLIYS